MIGSGHAVQNTYLCFLTRECDSHLLSEQETFSHGM